MGTCLKKVFIVAVTTFLLIIMYKGMALASNLPPVPIISGPTTVEVNKPYEFSGLLSYDPDGKIVEYSWFASGATPLTSSASVQTFMWSLAGTKSIYLWVTDNDGLRRQTYLTLDIIDPKPPMTGISHYSSSIEFKVGGSCQVGITNYPTGSEFAFLNDGGIGEVDIYPSGNTATLIGTKSGDKRLGYIVSHPDYASYRGHIDLVISDDDKNYINGIYWYSPSTGFTPGEDADIYIMGAPAGSMYTFSIAGTANAYIKSTNNNMASLGITSAGEIRLNYIIACSGYYDYNATIVINAYEKEKPTAHITSISSGYTGEWYTFSALNSTNGVDGYEWKWHDPVSGTVVSTRESFDKIWYANQYGEYKLYLRVSKDSVWSEWTSKLVSISQGISFDPDDVYSGIHTITDDEWAYIRQKTGTSYEKSYDYNHRTYLLNVEIYQDKNLLVYGDYTLNGNDANAFSSESEGVPYFRRNKIAGEYQYLGYIYGTNTPFSNQNYKAKHLLNLHGPGKNAQIIPLTSVPDSYRQSWGLTEADNSEFYELQNEINSCVSYGFWNNNAANSPSPLVISNVFSYDSVPYDPYGYGIVNFLDKYIGGSIRLFFEYYKNGGYDWRTFEGIIDNPVQCPEISIHDDIIKWHVKPKGGEDIRISGEIYLSVFDDKKDNALVNRNAFFYDRDDVYAADLNLYSIDAIKQMSVSDFSSEVLYYDNHFVLKKTVEIVIDASLLHNGVNEFEFETTGGISFASNAKRSTSYTFVIRVEHGTDTIPIIETMEPLFVSSNAAALRYQIHSLGIPNASEAGIYISSDGISYTEHTGDYPSTGVFDLDVFGLLPNSTYWYKAYIKQGADVFFGTNRSFKTPMLIRTAPMKPIVTEITHDSARITSDDGSLIVCNGEEKPSGSIFFGLQENTEYSTYAYFPKDTMYERSPNSQLTHFKTLETPYELEDRFISVGDTVYIEDCDQLTIMKGLDIIETDSREITGIKEGMAVVKGALGKKETLFNVYVFSILKDIEEVNKIIDLRVKKVYDPDFIGFGSFEYSELPIFEHPDASMIELGYLVKCAVVFSKDEIPDIPLIRLFDSSGNEYDAYLIQGGEFVKIPVVIQNIQYIDRTLFFDIYIRPDHKFFIKGEVVDIGSVQSVEEILVCLEFDKEIDIEEGQVAKRIISKQISTEFTQIFWYNLRRTCYDDIGYEKGW